MKVSQSHTTVLCYFQELTKSRLRHVLKVKPALNYVNPRHVTIVDDETLAALLLEPTLIYICSWMPWFVTGI